jgi:guanosine-3',5'-bis(diphosphate) 3'-pyrophosphohydrolase
MDLFPDEIYVFTPKGKILVLPRKATAVDFAYAVHTDVGNSCVACRIDRRHAPLSEPLESGQTVEILVSAGARPNPSWLDYAVTAKARSNIHHYLKNQTREDSIALGRNLLDKSLAAYGSGLDQLTEERIADFLQTQGYSETNELLADIARGNRLPAITAPQLLLDDALHEDNPSAAPVAICGTEGFVVSYGRCCHPIPGDAIEGYLSSEKGIVVHRQQCKNLADMREDHHERLVSLMWDDDVQGEYTVELRIEVENRRGMFAVIATRINSMGVNIERISSEDKDYQFTNIHLELAVENRVHLARVLRRLRSINHVRKVVRVKN